MALNTNLNLTNSVQIKYQAEYQMRAKQNLYYDQLSWVVQKDDMVKGSSIKVPFYHSLAPATEVLNEFQDVTPVQFGDSMVEFTPYMRGNALMVSEKLRRTAFTNIEQVAAKNIGMNAGESVDYYARTVCTQGSNVMYAGSATSRATVDRANDQISFADFMSAAAQLQTWGVEPVGGNYVAVMHPALIKDIIEDGTIILLAEYGGKPEFILRGEIGMVGGIKIVKTNWAKVFLGAGAAQGSAISTTLAAAVSAGATTVTLTADTNAGVGDYLTIGPGIETAAVEYPTTERVKIVAGSGSPFTIIGEGVNGGFRYDHAILETVKDNDSVHAVVFYGANSIGKVYSGDLGPMGKILPPEDIGILKTIRVMGWKWFGGHARVAETRLLRLECASSLGI